MSLKRRVSCPLVRSKSFQLPTSEVGPDDLYIVEPLRFSPEKKKKRCKTKGGDKVETLRASVSSATGVSSEPRCNGESSSSSSLQFLPSTCNGYASTCSSRDCASEGSSESSASTLSEESFGSAPSMNGHDPILCNGEPPPAKSKMEKRSMKRRKSKNAEQHEAQRMGEILPLPVTVMPTLEELMKGKADLATFGRTAVTGRV